jgi:hypothetical protein
MIRFLHYCLISLLLCTVGSPARAWWEYGHYTVADIAIANVKPATRQKVEALLAQGKLLETPECPVNTLALAAYWADCVKTLGDRFNYQFSWHFQNVNICKPFDLKPACADGNCVSAQVDRAYRLLKGEGRGNEKPIPVRERLIALANLAHFVGDLHQPLHAGDRADLGGNRVRADYGVVRGSRLNLHSIWDGPLAERAISTPPPIIRTYSANERASMGAGTTQDWSREAWQISRDITYKTARSGDPCTAPDDERGELTQDEIMAAVPVVQDMVVKGGLRLARLLDEALADD